MFPEHVERSFLDPEYSFVAVRRTMIHFLTELLVRRTWFRQSKLYFVFKLRPELAADAPQTA